MHPEFCPPVPNTYLSAIVRARLAIYAEFCHTYTPVSKTFLFIFQLTAKLPRSETFCDYLKYEWSQITFLKICEISHILAQWSCFSAQKQLATVEISSVGEMW